MLPMFAPPGDEEHDSPPPRGNAALSIGMGLIVAIGLIVLAAFAGSPTSLAIPAIIALILLIGAGVLGLMSLMSRAATPKGKRIENLDMYSLINRLVIDLDEDELAYLERKIAERKRHPDQKLAEDMGTLLEQRDDARRAGSR